MTKYKTVGILNLFLGILEVFFALFAFVFIVPKLTSLYSEFGTELPSFVSIYLILGVIILMGIGNLFFGFNLISKPEKKDKYFKFALFLLIASFLLSGIFSSIGIILPIYDLTSQF